MSKDDGGAVKPRKKKKKASDVEHEAFTAERAIELLDRADGAMVELLDAGPRNGLGISLGRSAETGKIVPLLMMRTRDGQNVPIAILNVEAPGVHNLAAHERDEMKLVLAATGRKLDDPAPRLNVLQHGDDCATCEDEDCGMRSSPRRNATLLN